jgi:ParB family chromosome partitioning protein
METTTEITHAKIMELFPNPYQPQSRLEVKEETAREFGKSILEKGLLQVPVVRSVDKGKGIIRLEMVDGWLRHSGFAWLVANGHPEYEMMPIIIRPFTDQQMAYMIYVTNKERKDLTPIDLAWYYKKYLAEFKTITQTELARTLNISQGEIANTIRLLDLPSKVQDMIISHEITESHGRSLLQLKNMNDMLIYAEDAAKNNWSVITLDNVIKTYLESQKPKLAETPKKKCRVCGCTDDNACVVEGVPCHWVEEDLCSACAEKKADEKSNERQEIVQTATIQSQKKVDEKPAEKTKSSTPAKPNLKKPEPARTAAPPTPIKPAWKRKLVLEETADGVKASIMAEGKFPVMETLPGALEQVLDIPIDFIEETPIALFFSRVNEKWNPKEVK